MMSIIVGLVAYWRGVVRRGTKVKRAEHIPKMRIWTVRFPNRGEIFLGKTRGFSKSHP